MKLKYIIDTNNRFLIFSETIIHASIRSEDLGKIVGAGFCTIDIGYDPANEEYPNVHCFGESVSLRIASREEDEKIINNQINNKLF